MLTLYVRAALYPYTATRTWYSHCILFTLSKPRTTETCLDSGCTDTQTTSRCAGRLLDR